MMVFNDLGKTRLTTEFLIGYRLGDTSEEKDSKSPFYIVYRWGEVRLVFDWGFGGKECCRRDAESTIIEALTKKYLRKDSDGYII